MTLRSVRYPRFASLSDAEVLAAYTELDRRMHETRAQLDYAYSIEMENALDDMECDMFELDDELCARDLDPPT